ncbi:MAG: hypothetical protein WEB88_03645 [Gemmatimonadota bacterium]
MTEHENTSNTSGARMRSLATDALNLVRRVERTGGMGRAIRHPGVAPEWWREMMREAQADAWSDEAGPDRQRHLFACAALADLAGGGGSASVVERVSAPTDAAALLAWLRSAPHRTAYVSTARLLGDNEAAPPAEPLSEDLSPATLTPGQRASLVAGYLYEQREVAWIVEDCVREAAELDPGHPLLRVRDRDAELAQAARAARAALGVRGNGGSKERGASR